MKTKREKVLERALQSIAKWHGEFPVTGKFYDVEETRPMSYGAAYGSNGERDYMRTLALNALDTPEDL
jgi:hypothetical protein